MNSFFTYQFIALFLLIVCAAVGVTWFIIDTRKIIKRFLGETAINTDEDIINSIMRRIARIEAKLEETEPRLHILETIATSSIQKLGFVRFNPFPDTGGDNSFMLILLDREHTGILLSSLYMREGARLYAKSIEKGKPKQTLSAEENKLLEQTLHG